MKRIPYGKQTISDEDINEVVKVLKSDFLTTGPKITEFEERIAKYCGAKYCVCVSSGTAALHLSSIVLLNEGDKVLTTPNSFLATSNSILYVKAKPIFVDICENGNIDLDLCEDELKKDKKIKAIYVVHFSGNPINQNKLRYLKDKYNIKILEDCAHSIGSSYEGVKSGSCQNSDLSIFSFHPVKNLTTGEGGAITTNSKEYYNHLHKLANHCTSLRPDIGSWHYDMNELGFNYRLTDISAALGISQLKKLDSFIKRRKEIAKKYDKYFHKIKYISPLYKFTENSSYHLYVIKINFSKFNISKKELFEKLKIRNIFIQVHYIPINKQPYYKNLGYGNEKTPIMDKYHMEALSLPIFPKLTTEDQDYVIESLLEVLDA